MPPEEPPQPAHARDLEHAEYEPAGPEWVEWTPERAASALRALGFLLHHADGAARVKPPEHADDPRAACYCDACRLWRMTEQDALEAGAPLARILNRYEPARRLAGVSDEVELTVVLGGYAKRNLATRGRLVQLKASREETGPPGREPAPPPAAEPERDETVTDWRPPEATLGYEWQGEGYLPPPPVEPPERIEPEQPE